MIRDNILKIRERISLACSKVNRGPGSITIVAVSKGRNAREIRQAIEAGITDIGENKVREALVKYNDLREEVSGKQVKWHMVGHLQTNKVRDAVRIFDLIQSVDSLRLAQEIDRQAAKISKAQDVLVEIKTSFEESKSGIRPQDAAQAISEIGRLKNVNVKGLMTIAPLLNNPGKARPYFRALRELKDSISGLQILSMGMTDDFEIAIEEGSNMVRLGRAIFEDS